MRILDKIDKRRLRGMVCLPTSAKGTEILRERWETMSIFRNLGFLQRTLGDDLFSVLFDPFNRERVKRFLEALQNNPLGLNNDLDYRIYTVFREIPPKQERPDEFFSRIGALQKYLGEAGFLKLIEPLSAVKVKKFCDIMRQNLTLIHFPLLPIGRRGYTMSSAFYRGEHKKQYSAIVELAKERDAHAGGEDGGYILDNQADIPTAFRGRVELVFTDWQYNRGKDVDGISGVRWNSVVWERFACELDWWARCEDMLALLIKRVN